MLPLLHPAWQTQSRNLCFYSHKHLPAISIRLLLSAWCGAIKHSKLTDTISCFHGDNYNKSKENIL